MHPVYVIIAIAAIIMWIYFIYLVSEEIGKFRVLASNEEASSYSVHLMVPNWCIFHTMAFQRPWVLVALILAPLLVVTWGAIVLLGFIFIVTPQFSWEMLEDVWWTIKKSTSRT